MKSGSPSSNNRAAAMRQFFQWLEQRFGGVLPMDSGPAAEVMVRDTLRGADLQRLFQHQATALHIPNYFPRNSAIELGKSLAWQVQDGQARNWKVSTAQGLESSDVFTLGAHAPFNVAVSNQRLDEYYTQVQEEFRQRRRNEDNNSAKMIWPLDQFRLELDQAWPLGAGLSRDANKSEQYRGGGLPRIMLGPTRWKRGFVHVDELAPLSPTNGFFSANIYLQLPDMEQTDTPQNILEVWPLAVKNKWDWYKDAEMQILLRKALGEPQRIAVQPGDLIVLCVQRPHAAIGFSHEGIRVSLQCFIQYSGLKERLSIES